MTVGQMNAVSIFREARAQHEALPREWQLPYFGQIGIVVEDPETASACWGPRLGITSWYRPRFTKSRSWTPRRSLNQSFDIIFGYSGRTQIELVSVSGWDRGIFAIPTQSDQPKIHHLGYFVRDIDQHSQELQDRGLEPSQFGFLRLARSVKTRLAYWDLRESGFGILELIEQRFLGLRIGMPERLAQLGTLTGHLERIR